VASLREAVAIAEAGAAGAVRVPRREARRFEDMERVGRDKHVAHRVALDMAPFTSTEAAPIARRSSAARFMPSRSRTANR